MPPYLATLSTWLALEPVPICPTHYRTLELPHWNAPGHNSSSPAKDFLCAIPAPTQTQNHMGQLLGVPCAQHKIE